MNRLDRHIIQRLFTTTLFVLLVLIFIFIVIDFSESSDEFTDRGATINEIINQYYFNYIPEMVRLVTPVAVFIACLLVTGQMSDRFEIVALKAAGVSLYRLFVPYLVFALISAVAISYLDGYIVPDANSERIEFEREYLENSSDRLDRNQIYRQESDSTILSINYFDGSDTTAFRIDLYTFDRMELSQQIHTSRMEWNHTKELWVLKNGYTRVFHDSGYTQTEISETDTLLNILPRDLARTSSDIYQLTYPKSAEYIAALERSGAGNIGLPKTQFYGRLSYPFSIFVVVLIGFAIASVRRKGGKGVYVAAGFSISFLYLALMKIIEPFGSTGELDPLWASIIPHITFFCVGVALLVTAKK